MLGKIGKFAIPALAEAFNDKDYFVCKSAAEALDKIGDQAAIHTITRVLRDVVEDVQWSVRQSMRKLKGARA